MAAPGAPALTPDQIARLHEDRGPALVAASSFFIAACTVTVALRFAARYSRRMEFGLDDWLSVAALVFLILYAVTTILAVPYGTGKHIWAADPLVAYKTIEISLYNAFIYVIVNWLIKLSILAFYKRVFTLNVDWFRYALYATCFYITGWFLGALFAAIFQCSPVDYFWTQYNPHLNPPAKGSCTVNGPALVISSSALNSLGDIIIFILPIVLMLQLQLSRAKRIALVLVFTTGALSIAAGLTRLSQSVSITKKNADSTWITADLYLWTTIEAGVGLICACLPVIGPFFGLVKQRASSYFQARSSRKTFESITDRSTKKSFANSDFNQSRTIRVGGGPAPFHGTSSMDQRGILRTDEFDLESLPKTDDNWKDNLYFHEGGHEVKGQV